MKTPRPIEHHISYGRVGQTFKVDCTCGWSKAGTKEQVYAAVAQHKNSKADKKSARLARIKTMWADGLSMQQIGDEFGIVRQRVFQILKRDILIERYGSLEAMLEAKSRGTLPKVSVKRKGRSLK